MLLSEYQEISGRILTTPRYLDPATGRFLTRDPIGIEGGINLYAYVGNGVVMKADPLGFATWCEVNPRLGIVYDHAFIRFDLIKCDGATTWGFWPGEGKSCPLFPAPGVWRGPDPHEGSCKPVKQITDIRFEKALCDCIKESKRRGRTYQFPCYACGTGVKDMWNCAKARVFPVPPRPSPVFPPDVILPGQCIRLPNGRIICG
ncbi:MAG: hypothetical protein KatS3mg023_2148 [Armatimonadota bacterium]|nr:MAG: hypothetical protein KatS3mg023_2148 [Armatimonadota bacterium]